ncbi:molybdopterin-dependent oxidoreductase [Chitinivorax sp. PXF-14]|uniref:molybdopterin-dependent oxidoreductase n=1 Tax=Chitinivorax sp. PXF-14 TaxID=3230488 RepID=UPI003467100B
MMLTFKQLCLAAAFTVLPLVAQAAGKVDNPAQYVTHSVSVSGAVAKQLTLTVADLKKMPAAEIGAMPIVCQSGATMEEIKQYKGVKLKDVLDRAEIVSRDHNDTKKMVIVATASDGYKAVFSWQELYNSPLGDEVVVFFEKNGKLLDDDEGQIALISAKDLRAGPRHVKWLQSLEVIKLFN